MNVQKIYGIKNWEAIAGLKMEKTVEIILSCTKLNRSI